MLAYRVRFGLDTGHLVYAKGEEEPRIHEVIGHGICPLSCDQPQPAPIRTPEPDVTVSRKNSRIATLPVDAVAQA
jgi:hypothetical protein